MDLNMAIESSESLDEFVSHEREYKEVVSALIIQNGKALLMRRAAHETFPGAYELPGGTVEENETHQQAITREIFEETSLPVTVIRALLGSFEFPSQSDTNARNFVYLTEIEEGAVVLSEEHDDYLFINPEEAFELQLSPNARHALGMFSTNA